VVFGKNSVCDLEKRKLWMSLLEKYNMIEKRKRDKERLRKIKLLKTCGVASIILTAIMKRDFAKNSNEKDCEW
jgi:hypothetical protein